MENGDRVRSRMSFIKCAGTVIDTQHRVYPFATATIRTQKYMVQWDDGEKSGWMSENDLIKSS